MNILPIINIALALTGLFICYKIHCQKRGDEPMVCPLGADCKTVLHSKYGSFFGIGLEYMGAIYYSIILIGYALQATLWPDYIPLILGLFALSCSGLLFSIYLTSIQAITIKSWCSWCLFSAGISTTIFIISSLSVWLAEIDFINIAKDFKQIFVLLHLLGFAIGVGGATISDLLFFKFLKDFKISESENSILHFMSSVIWVGLGIAVLSGVGLYLGNMEVLNETPKFLVKTIIVIIIIINGTLLNLFVSPRLVTMSFKHEDDMKNILPVKKAQTLRRIAFAGGGISFVSWYSAATLGGLRTLSFEFWTIFGTYAGLIFIAIIFSQIFERWYCNQRN